MVRASEQKFENLPADLPVFPLPRVILLPRVDLPLNIFEPRYLAMIDHAMSTHRLIGMVQRGEGEALYQTGCAGRITSYEETNDGRYLITLRGVCRFDIADILPSHESGFRRIIPDWKPYRDDFTPDAVTDICRETMMQNLRGYLDKMDMFCDQWDKIKNVSCDSLISTLSVVCPFGAEEKQALLEAPTLHDRAKILMAFLDMAVKSSGKTQEQDTCH